MKEITESAAEKVSSRSLLAMAENNPVVIKRKGKPSWALVPLNGIDLETYLVARSPVFKRIIARSRRRLKLEGGIPLEEAKRIFGIK